MRHRKILLLDTEQTSHLGDELCEIIGPSLNADNQLQRASLNVDKHPFGETDLVRLLSTFDPDAIFIAPATELTAQASGLLQLLKKASGKPVVAILNNAVEPDEIFALFKLGVADFVTPPLRASEIIPRVRRLIEGSRKESTIAHKLKEKFGLRHLIGGSLAFVSEIKKIPLVAKCNASVLISGETGTGKELCARAIHYLSPRAGKPFVPVNCGAVPLDLVENELFGHERGAYTGAETAKAGLIHEAGGGTVFLDEIDCLPLPAQVKLLRFLQEGEYRPLGSAKTRKAEVRVIAATNIDSEEALNAGRLRRDLYYRLNVIPLALPSLRERRDDIVPLARHFLKKYAEELDKPLADFSAGARRLLESYDWPGNVRELENIVERAVVLCEDRVIRGADISIPGVAAEPQEESFQTAKNRVVEEFEKTYIKSLLQTHGGNITKAAQAAKKNRRAFWQLIRKNKIDARSFKPNRS